jgi:hypothetical protein
MQRRSAMRCHNAGRARAWVCKTRLSLLYWGGLVSSAFRLFRRSGVDVARRILASLRDRHAPSHDGIRRMGRNNLPNVLAVGSTAGHPRAPGLSLAGVRLVIPDHALGLPGLRALSLCTCCRQYSGVATGRTLRSFNPAVSAFPDMAVGSAYTSSVSRLARRSLALRPAHSRCHQFVTR